MKTLTIDNIPDEVYDRLVHEAHEESRSLRDLVIDRLAGAASCLVTRKIEPRGASDLAARVQRVDEFRERLRRQGVFVTEPELASFTESGRG